MVGLSLKFLLRFVRFETRFIYKRMLSIASKIFKIGFFHNPISWGTCIAWVTIVVNVQGFRVQGFLIADCRLYGVRVERFELWFLCLGFSQIVLVFVLILVLVIFPLFVTVLAKVLKNTSRIFVFEDEYEYDNESDDKINPKSTIQNPK